MLNGKYSFTEEQFCLIDKMLCEVEMDVKEIEKVEPFSDVPDLERGLLTDILALSGELKYNSVFYNKIIELFIQLLIISFTLSSFCASYAGLFSEDDLTTKITNGLSSIQDAIVKIATPAAAVAIGSGLLMKKLSFGDEEKIKKEVEDLKKEGTVESIHKPEGTNLTELLDNIINDANAAKELIGGNISSNTISKPKTFWHKTSVELPPRRDKNCNLSIDVLDPCGDKCHYHYGVHKWSPSRGCGEYPSPPPYWTELPIFDKENH